MDKTYETYIEGHKDVKCDLCNAEGFTEKQYKPRMIQDGWEEI